MRIQIEDYLRQFGKQKVLYTPNPGNAGDSIIAAATYQTFDRVGLNYTVVRPSLLDARGQIVICGGGGNLVKPTTFSSRYIGKHHRQAGKLVILPHTVKEVDELLGEFGSNVDIICRELPSYEYVRAKAPLANVYLDHDMAFSFDVNAFLSGTQYSSPSYPGYLIDRYLLRKSVPSWTSFLHSRNAVASQKKVCDTAKINNELNCFRLDGESCGQALPADNFDLSILYEYGTESPAVAGLSAQAVLNTLKQFSVIHTDRLHMAISSALLGLTVHFHANNYYKCRAVYEFSIKDRYPNVIWHD
jgi:exopolysaccharide biosynthesis predicted pyruvyltransferase EpsI